MQRYRRVLKAIVLVGLPGLGLSGIALAADTTISGFLSVGGGKSSENTTAGYAGYNEDQVTFDADTLFGLQVTSQVSEKVKVTGQLEARGSDDYKVEDQWAYVSYAFNDNVTARAGRLRTPLYLYSDFVDVGYAYSWIRPPSDVYYLPFNNVQGMDFVWNFSAGPVDSTIQGYFGALTDNFNLNGEDVNTKLRKQTGLSYQANWNWLTFRTAYHQATLTVDSESLNKLSAAVTATCGGLALAQTQVPFPLAQCSAKYDYDQLTASEDKGKFLEFGLLIDTSHFVAALEKVTFKVDNSPFSDDIRSYGMVGWRFGDFLLHFTHSVSADKRKDLRTGIPTEVALPPVQLPPAFYALQAAIRALNCTRGSNPLSCPPGQKGALEQTQTTFDTDAVTDSLGLRWDFATSTAFKIEVQKVKDDRDGDQTITKFAIQSVF